jgi:hypothetical protein
MANKSTKKEVQRFKVQSSEVRASEEVQGNDNPDG